MHGLPTVLADIRKHGIFSFDYEAKSKTGNSSDAKNPWTAEATILALAGPNKFGSYELTDEVIVAFRALMLDDTMTGVAHHINYDCLLADLSGHIAIDDVLAKIHDTIVLSWLIDEEMDHGLKPLVKKYLRYTMVTYKEATEQSTVMQGIARCQEALDRLNLAKGDWDRRRPYPELKSEVMTKHKIRKILREQGMDKPEISLKIKEIFGLDQYLLFEAFYNQWVPVISRNMADLEVKAYAEFKAYAADDARQTLRLYFKLLKLIQKDELEDWLEIESAVRMETVKMERNGVAINLDMLKASQEVIDPLIAEFEETIFGAAGSSFLISSPKQLQKVLYVDLNLMPPEFEKVWDPEQGQYRKLPKISAAGKKIIEESGIAVDLNNPSTLTAELRLVGFSTDALTLGLMPHPISQAVLNWRSVTKLRTTYTSKLAELVENSADKRLHARFNSLGAVTGRWSSSRPPLQTIPSRAKSAEYDERIQTIGPELRAAFEPPPPDEENPEGYALVISDQSQVELRLITHFCEDPTLQSIYERGVIVNGVMHYTGDIHAETSNNLGIPRKLAKNVNFGFNYGMGPPKFARQIRLIKPGTLEYDIEKATEYRNGFFGTYARLPEYIRYLKHGMDAGNMCYSTVSGRFRHFPHVFVTGGTILNSKVQGSSADFIKANVHIIAKYVLPRYPGAYLAMQVHDELIYICPKRFSVEFATLVKYVMEYPWFTVSVPILATTKVCHNNWAESGDDSVPEIGEFFARVNGEDRLFNAENWCEMAALPAKAIQMKGAASRLSQEDLTWCRTIIPDNGPLIKTEEVGRVMSRAEELALREMS
jgi:DNA polymerase I-like protein with 3'-5' exonuclease and polymerase domains